MYNIFKGIPCNEKDGIIVLSYCSVYPLKLKGNAIKNYDFIYQNCNYFVKKFYEKDLHYKFL